MLSGSWFSWGVPRSISCSVSVERFPIRWRSGCILLVLLFPRFVFPVWSTLLFFAIFICLFAQAGSWLACFFFCYVSNFRALLFRFLACSSRRRCCRFFISASVPFSPVGWDDSAVAFSFCFCTVDWNLFPALVAPAASDSAPVSPFCSMLCLLFRSPFLLLLPSFSSFCPFLSVWRFLESPFFKSPAGFFSLFPPRLLLVHSKLDCLSAAQLWVSCFFCCCSYFCFRCPGRLLMLPPQYLSK